MFFNRFIIGEEKACNTVRVQVNILGGPPPPPRDSVWNYTFFLFTLQGNETTNGGADNHLCADNIQIPAASSITYFCRPKVYGRYLYIRIPGSNKMLTLCEVEVYSLSKSVNLSSCLFCRYA